MFFCVLPINMNLKLSSYVKLDNIVRTSYTTFVIVLLLIVWTPFRISGRLRSRHIDFRKHPPCFFNQLCTCSKTYPDFGIVKCQNIPFFRIPQAISSSKLFVLHLSNNKLHTISPYFLKSTGLYRLEIINNPIVSLPNEAFSGLERSLWELELKYNQLLEVPSKALRYLQKLRRLDLTGNEISKIESETWRGLEHSLEELILANNQINYIPSQTFSALLNLIMLDLSANNLRLIESNAFSNGLEKLAHLSLSNNLLESIPYQQIISLNELKYLDLSFNQIRSMSDFNIVNEVNPLSRYRISLDVLKLDYNQFHLLETGSFKHFDTINITIFDGNPLIEIQPDAFREARIRELYFKDCEIRELSAGVFSGLEKSLEILDLSENFLSNISNEVFHNFNALESVSLRDNPSIKVHVANLFISNQHTLGELDLRGIHQKGFHFDGLKKLRNIRKLYISSTSKMDISPELFEDFSIDLIDLKISYSQVNILKNNAFAFIHGLVNLDLSDNKITKIEKNAFIDIGHSLKCLKMSNSLARTFHNFDVNFFRYITAIEYLDLSSNNIQQIPDRTFHYLKGLTVLRLQDNKIEEISRGTFQGDIHTKLEEINLSFNLIRKLEQHTFVDLLSLKSLNLQDNRISSIDRRSFMNLDELTTLNLKGNKIIKIFKETFQNLPELEILDLSFNLIMHLDFTIFDQIGTLAMLKVNFSNNVINSLTTNHIGGQIDNSYSNGYYINIKVLDLSSNNISIISRSFFKPIEVSIMEILLQKNELQNLSREVFGNMPHLQVLNLSHNKITEVNFDSFKNSPRLQILSLAFNRMKDLPTEAFQGLFDLKNIDLSNNNLKHIPDNLFQSDGCEFINLSHNELLRIPFHSISTASAATLYHLDLSYNFITSIPNSVLFNKLQSLAVLNLAHNSIGLLNDSTFANIPNLISLDLSNNAQLELKRYGHSFRGIEKSLIFLYLNNVSLISIPDLPLMKLRHLSLANNALPTVPPEIATNLTSLRILDLSYNDLTSIPLVIHSLNNLRSLILKNNPISSISNHSFIGLSESLTHLDLRNLLLTSFENGALTSLSALRNLQISVFKFVRDFAIPDIVDNNKALRILEISVEHGLKLTSKHIEGFYPEKLSTIILEGSGVDSIPDHAFKGIQSSRLNIQIKNSKIRKISKKLFANMMKVRNLTIDVRRNELHEFENPSTGRRIGESKSTFLLELKIAFNPWKCDCSLGWVEFWQRKVRQYISTNVLENNDDLREARCVNRGNITLIEILKVDLECGGWGRGASQYNFSLIFILLTIFVTYILNYN